MIDSSFNIKDRYLAVQERVNKALSQSNRPPNTVRLIAASKLVSAERIRTLYDCGHRLFGENRVQEWLGKKDELPPDIEWHFIGHLQTNKVKKLAEEELWIDSIDSVRLAEALDREAEKRGCSVRILLQVNTSGEATKSGFHPSGLEEAVEKIQKFSQLHPKGLMTIGPMTQDERKVRQAFQQLRELKEKVSHQFPADDFCELSMGMSHDFEWAIAEGATLIRIGTLLFGERKV